MRCFVSMNAFCEIGLQIHMGNRAACVAIIFHAAAHSKLKRTKIIETNLVIPTNLLDLLPESVVPR